MKSELRIAPHGIHPHENVVEVWYEGEFVCAVYGADGPGLRVITKDQVLVSQTSMITELTIVKHETPNPTRQTQAVHSEENGERSDSSKPDGAT